MQFGKSKAKLVSKEMSKITFDDVAGIEEAHEELNELKEFLKNPKKFEEMGAKILTASCSMVLLEPERP